MDLFTLLAGRQVTSQPHQPTDTTSTPTPSQQQNQSPVPPHTPSTPTPSQRQNQSAVPPPTPSPRNRLFNRPSGVQSAPIMSKPVAPTPPLLQSDATFQVFRQWRLRFEDYAVLVGLHNLPQGTQLIHLRTCISLDVQRLLVHTLGIPHDTTLSVKEVLDALQEHFRSLRNEALRRRELLSCKQAVGEPFADYHARLKDLAAEVDLCTGNPTTCADRQLQMILLTGLQDEELIRRLIALDASSTLADFVKCCRSYESTRATASAIASVPSHVNAASSYKKNQRQKKTTSNRPTDQQSTASDSCQRCLRQHDQGKCPATNTFQLWTYRTLGLHTQVPSKGFPMQLMPHTGTLCQDVSVHPEDSG